MHQYKDAVIWCCEAVQLLVLLLMVRRVYYGVAPDNGTKKKARRFVIFACFVLLFSFICKLSVEHLYK
jgi:hypothetical protein